MVRSEIRWEVWAGDREKRENERRENMILHSQPVAAWLR